MPGAGESDISVDLLHTWFSVSPLGTLGGNSSEAVAVNNSGSIVGAADVPANVLHACLWIAGEIHDLDPSNLEQSVAYAINERGQIVGRLDRGGLTTVAAMWEGTRLHWVEDLVQSKAAAFGVNEEGVVVGWLERRPPPLTLPRTVAVLWERGKRREFGEVLRQNSYALAINNRGQVAGGGSEFAFFWERGKFEPIYLPDGGAGSGSAINELGHVVGTASVGGVAKVADTDEHAFFWEGARTVDLGTLGGRFSQAEDINSLGYVVGRYDVRATGPDGPAIEHGFIWKGGPLVDLNDLIPPHRGWTIKVAHGINDHGQIVGVGSSEGRSQAVLLTPQE